jgi:hypothetical protein
MPRSQITGELLFRARAEGFDRADSAFIPASKCPAIVPTGLWRDLPEADRIELEGTTEAAYKARWGELEAEHLRRSELIVLATKVRTPSGVVSAAVVREIDWDVPRERSEARVLLAQVLEAEARMIEIGQPLITRTHRDPARYIAELEQLRGQAR